MVGLKDFLWILGDYIRGDNVWN